MIGTLTSLPCPPSSLFPAHKLPIPISCSCLHAWHPLKPFSSQKPQPRIACKWRIQAAENNPSDANETSALTDADVEELEAKLGKRRRSRKDKTKVVEPPLAPKPKPKDWDSMTLAEKAWEIYVGEKGVLFWINKLAYASIFLIVGGWIAFRFIGPAFGWYQLESPLLPPDQVFGGTK